MVKIFFIFISLPAIAILLHSICAINAMSHATKESIRWSNIIIASGAFIQILSMFAAFSTEYNVWFVIKSMLTGAFLINFGYAVLYMANKHKCECLTCVYGRKEKEENVTDRRKANC